MRMAQTKHAILTISTYAMLKSCRFTRNHWERYHRKGFPLKRQPLINWRGNTYFVRLMLWLLTYIRCMLFFKLRIKYLEKIDHRYIGLLEGGPKKPQELFAEDDSQWSF